MIKAIFFDLDGVLVDSRELHYESLNFALAKYGYEITRDEHLSTFDGLPTTKKLQKLTEIKGLSKEYYENIWIEKQKQTIRIIDNEFVYDERIRSILRQLKSDGFLLAVCSNSIRETVKMMLVRKGFIEFIDFYISNEDVKFSKPNPEMYLKAMIMMGIGPKDCVIIEDSHHGRKAAYDSGAYVCAVENTSDVTYEKINKVIEHSTDKNNISKFIPKWQDTNLRIVIPMAGEDNIFQSAGFDFPKPLVDINGKPMIQWVVENINVEGKFIFIVQKKHFEQYSYRYLLNLIAPGCEIIIVNDSGQGAATTVLQAKELINDDRPVAIINSDQFLEWNSNEFFYAMTADTCEGGLVTFESTHPRWSFVKLDENGFVAEVAEKTPISNMATAGVYFFRKGTDFIRALEKTINSQTHFQGKFYVSLVYNQYIHEHKNIRVFPRTTLSMFI